MTVLQDLRVLVVENDEMSAALLQMQLVHAGATVVGLAARPAPAMRRRSVSSWTKPEPTPPMVKLGRTTSG